MCSPEHVPTAESKSALSLRMVLTPLFHQGWSPLRQGMFKLGEEAVLYLKGLDMDKADTSELPVVLQDAVGAMRKMRHLTENLEAVKEKTQKRLAAISKCAESKYMAVADDPTGLQKRKIEGWMLRQHADLQKQVETAEEVQLAARDVFESMVDELINAAHVEFMSAPPPLDEVKVEVDLEKLEMELDLALELEIQDHDQKCKEEEPSQRHPAAPAAPAAGKEMEPEQATRASGPGGVDALNNAPSTVVELPGPSNGNVVPEPSNAAGNLHENEQSQAARLAGDVCRDLARKDTSQRLARGNTQEMEDEALARCRVELPDGSVKYRNPKGNLESYEQRLKRVGHNEYMRFSRSIDSHSDQIELLDFF